MATVRAPFAAAEGEYRLEVVAFSADYPPNPVATNRTFSAPAINEAGLVLFTAGWRDTTPPATPPYFHGSMNLGRPGAVAPILRTKDAAPPFAGMHFKGFGFQTFNASGEVLFVGFMDDSDPTKPPPFDEAVWKGTAGNFTLLAAKPWDEASPEPIPTFQISGLPYSGTGRLQCRPPLAWRLADNDNGYYYASIDAQENGTVIPLIEHGLITARLLTAQALWYKNGPAPGLTGDYVFEQVPYPGPAVAQRNGNFVGKTLVRLRTAPDPEQATAVFYQFTNGQLLPFYKAGDPLPDLPPLSQVLGSSDYDLTVAGADVVDDTGNTLLEVTAVPRNGSPDYRQVGFWKKLPSGLQRVFLVNQDYQVTGGTVRFGSRLLGGNPAWRTAIGNGRIAFVSDFTGLGYTSTFINRGLFREEATGFKVIALPGMTVPGSTVRLGYDLGEIPELFMNELGEVVFRVSSQQNAAAPFVSSLWVFDRAGALRPVVRDGEGINVNGADRTVASFEVPTDGVTPAASTLAFNDNGALVFTATFTDGTKAIIRAVPDGYVDPPPPLRDYWFNNARNDGNWHSVGAGPPTNWEDIDHNPRSQPPGDADVNVATAFISAGQSVLLDQRPVAISTLNSEGVLTLRQPLTLHDRSALQNLVVEAPAGAVTFDGDQLTLRSADWQGNLLLNNATLRSEGHFIARSGTVSGTGAATAFDNVGLLRKDGGGTFTIDVPFRIQPPLSAGPAGVVTNVGTLSLTGGGSLGNLPPVVVTPGSTLELAGRFDVTQRLTGDGGGTVDLGTASKDVDLVPGSAIPLRLPEAGPVVRFNRGQITGISTSLRNEGEFIWNGGRLKLGNGHSMVQGLFINEGTFRIGNGSASRMLEGSFQNHYTGAAFGNGTVEQRGSFNLTGYVQNRNQWDILEPATITAAPNPGRFVNVGNLDVMLDRDGVVNIDATFSHLNRSHDAGIFSVGNPNPPHRATTVNLRGYVENLAAGALNEGWWLIRPGGILNFPGEITTIAERTLVEFYGGQIPSLNLRSNRGKLYLKRSATFSSGPLDNSFSGEVYLADTSVLTVKGSLDNSGIMDCGQGSKILLTGDLAHQSGGNLTNNGEIEVDGSATLNGRVSGTGTILADAAGFGYFVMVGSSPGILSVVAPTALTDSATLVIELAGTAPGRFDLLSITGPATISGTLVVNFIEGFRPAASDSFEVVQATSLTGQFANAANGQRIATLDGYGSMVVNYTPTGVILGAFELNPNPPPTALARLSTPEFQFDGTMSLTLTGTPGREYLLQSSSNLLDWSPVQTKSTSPDGLLRFEFPPAEDPKRYWRARAVNP